MKQAKYLYIILLVISCNNNSEQTVEAPVSDSSVQSQQNNIENVIPIISDTNQAITGNCFVGEFVGENGKIRKVIRFDSQNKTCQYVAFNATANTLMGRELDGRTQGEWLRAGDLLTINWDGFYVGRWNDENGNEKKYAREILSKYRLFIENNKIGFKEIVDSVVNAETDQDAPGLDYSLPYNGIYVFNSVACEEIESVYLKKDVSTRSTKTNSSTNNISKCSDMNSYDLGYRLAADQIGSGLMADCDYLFQIAQTTNDNLSHYCFCKGVNQWIRDHK